MKRLPKSVLGTVVAVIATLAIVLVGAVPAGAVPVVAQPAAKRSISDVPPLRSTGAKPVEPSVDSMPASIDAPKASSVLHQATAPKSKGAPSVFDPSKATVVSRDAFTTTYRNADGSNTTEVSAVPLNVKNDSGAWSPVSTTLMADTASGGMSVQQNPLHPTFKNDASADQVFSVDRGGFQVAYSLVGAARSTMQRPSPIASRSGDGADKVSYWDVFKGVDLNYQVQAGSVKETLKLASVPPSSLGSFTWRVSAPRLTLSKNVDGGVNFTDSSGTVQLNIPNPLMWDSSGVDGVHDNASTNVPLEVARSGSDWTITLTPSRAWLTDPSRVYPVFVDPTTWGGGADGIHSYKSDGTLRTDTILVGNARDPGDHYWRSVVHFPYEQLFGKQILDAYVATAMNGIVGTSNTFTGGVYCATSFAYGGVGANLGSLTIGSSGNSTGAGIAQQISSWVNAGSSGNYMMLTGQESPGTYTLKSLNAALYVSWIDYPATPTAVAPSPTGGARASLTPTFKTSSTDPAGAGLAYYYRVATGSDGETGQVWNSGWVTNNPATVPAAKLSPNTTYYYHLYVHDAYCFNTPSNSCSQVVSAVYSFKTNTPGVVAQGTALPANGSVIVSSTPTLSVQPGTDANGDTLKYQFRITTGSDGVSGVVATSDVITTTPIQWTVPKGVLQDGGAYSWVVIVDDGYDKVSGWVNTLRYTSRVGAPGPSPSDTAGGVTVNLANGNASLSFSSPTVSTLGGPMGLAFSYNSQQPSTAGLTGTYYDVTPASGQTMNWDFAQAGLAGKVKLVRTDPLIRFDWGNAQPAPAVPNINFMARWAGYVLAPSNGSYTFGFMRDNGAKLILNGSTAIDQYTDTNTAGAVSWGAAPELTTTAPGTYGPTPIAVEYFNHLGAGQLELWVKGSYQDSSGATVTLNPTVVPASWFSKSVETLPPGWSASTALVGSNVAYMRADIHEASVTLTDSDGTTHTYTKAQAGGGYTPPPGEGGVLVEDANHAFTLTDDAGTVYQFDPRGKVTAITQTADAKRRATPLLAYRTGTSQLSTVSDPLSLTGSTYSRQVVFAYSGDTAASVGLSAADTDGSGAACPVPTGYVPAPAGMICRIVYPGHVAGTHDTTQLLYQSFGTGAGSLDPAAGGTQLARIIDPGDEVTDFGYAGGLLSKIRSSLVNDWLTADASRSATGPVTTDLAYDTLNRVVSVTLPAPDGVTTAQRPAKTYTYTTNSDGSGSTTVVAAIGGSTTPPMTVAFDTGWRRTAVTSATGLTGSSTWNVKDQPVTTIDPSGRKTTTLYDSLDRLTDSYGPAGAACFGTDNKPVTSCPVPVAHTSTAYDESLHGLNATYYQNTSWSGLPSNYALGVGTTDGTVNANWGTSAPYSGGVATNWSLRLTGTITFPAAGTYTLNTYADDGTQVWLDNVLTINDFPGGTAHYSPTASVTVTAGQTKRIRVDYYQATGASSLQLLWTPPSGTRVLVPGGALSPAYGLSTSSHTDDSAPAGVSGVSSSQVPAVNTATTYGATPWLGIANSTSVDPTGLNLTTATAYESYGTAGYLRQKTQTLPGGNAISNNAYYSDNAGYGIDLGVSSPVCGLPTSTPQYGRLEGSTGAAPAVGSAIVTSYIYDLFGRVAATKATGDSDWTCSTYDLRGRVTTTAYAAVGTSAARTATTSYTADGSATGDPLTTWVQDNGVPGSPTSGRITTVTDLLGRVTSYSDVWGTVTTNTYNQLNQITATTSTPAGQAAATEQFTYDNDGRILTVTNGTSQTLAQMTYTNGELTAVAYPSGAGGAGSGVTGAFARDANTGAPTGLTWTFPGAQNPVSDSVVRSQSGRVLTDTIADGATQYASKYNYDTAGRLVAATIPHHQLTYRFAASGGCGANPSAGKNGNRTSFSDSKDGGAIATTTYC